VVEVEVSDSEVGSVAVSISAVLEQFDPVVGSLQGPVEIGWSYQASRPSR